MWGRKFVNARDTIRRRINQAFVQTFYVTKEGPIEPLIKEHLQVVRDTIGRIDAAGWEPGDPAIDPGPSDTITNTNEPGSSLLDPGSHKTLLAPRTGFEPVLLA